MTKKIMIVGGLGFLGSVITHKLLLEGRYELYVLESLTKLESSKEASSSLSEKVKILYQKDEKFFNFLDDKQSEVQVGFVDTLIFAVRNKNSNEVSSSLRSSLNPGNLLDQIDNTILDQLRILSLLGFDQQAQSDRKVIQLFSSNANFISHQPIEYHALNALTENVFTYLAVNLQKYSVRVFLIEIGVILNETIYTKNEFVDSSPDELVDLIKFLINSEGYGLVGKPLKLTGIRNLLDATSVAEGVFGDLRVRKT
jgi:hypothetical protein